MKVQFEFTAADLADVADRAIGRSPLVQKWRGRARVLWPLLAGVIAFLVSPGTPEVKAVVAALLAVALFVLGARRAAGGKGNPRVLAFYRERLGGDGPFLCEVEITEAGVVARQLGSESRHPWSQVASITEVQGGVEFVYRPMGSLLVRDRAFADAQARAGFLAQARGFLRAVA